MRYIEIILKLAFLGLSIFLMVYRSTVSVPVINIFLLICIFLGIVLLFNKDASYHFKQTKKDLMMRRFEGGILIVFAIVMSTSLF